MVGNKVKISTAYLRFEMTNLGNCNENNGRLENASHGSKNVHGTFYALKMCDKNSKEKKNVIHFSNGVFFWTECITSNYVSNGKWKNEASFHELYKFLTEHSSQNPSCLLSIQQKSNFDIFSLQYFAHIHLPIPPIVYRSL